jgi:hypothetical protein
MQKEEEEEEEEEEKTNTKAWVLPSLFTTVCLALSISYLLYRATLKSPHH